MLPVLHAFLQDEQPKSRPPSANAAAAVAAAAPAPFEQLFCGAFAALDRQWLARKATYMEFPAVMK
jgi:ELMO/CED-12 family